MKIIIITVLALGITAAQACTIKADVKKEGAGTAYVDGVSISKKIRAALSSQCKFKYNVLTKAQANKMTIDNLERRLVKLKAK